MSDSIGSAYALGSDTVLLTFLLFCRIGGCLMFMSGFSSARVPMQIRLFLAVAVTLALAPLLLPPLSKEVAPLSPDFGPQLLVSEAMTGTMIGLMGRMFFMALDFLGSAVATFTGFTNLPGIPIQSNEPDPSLSALITLTATVLFFAGDLHWEVLRGLIASYDALPVTKGYAAQFALVQFSNALSTAFALAVQISAPFIIYSIAINILFGIMNKLTPQIAVYFISLPFIVFGGLFILYFTAGELLKIFMSGLNHWLISG